MKQSQFYYLLRRGLFSAGSAIIKNGLVMFNKFTTAGLSFPAQGSAGFNGTSDYIQLNDPFSHTNHTTAAWVYVNGTPGTGVARFVIDARDGNDDGHRLFYYNGLFYSSVNTIDINFAATSNEWKYLVSTYDGSSLKLYIDGSEVVSSSVSTTISTTTNARIGSVSYSSPGEFWPGNLANVAIWNRALSSDEINSVMWKPVQALTATESNGLQAWYSLDDIASPTASLATMEQLATDKDATIENKAAITAAVNSLS